MKTSKPWWVYIATLADVGYLPAPGTCASALMLPILYGLQYAGISITFFAVITIAVALVSFIVIDRSLPYFKQNDPGPIVLDECLGMLIAFFGIPFSWYGLLIGFALFRLLDISKLFGLARLEKLPRAWGVLLDDVIAAILVNIVLRLLLPLGCI